MNLEHANPALFAAIAVAQAEVENATKDSTNPHFKSKYADLAEVLNTVRPVFSKHGLSLVQSTSFDGAMVSVTTALCHKEGGFITSTASCVPAKTDAQGIGAATTYLRRYSLSAISGVAQEDDDGNSAAHNAPPVVRIDTKQVNKFSGAILKAIESDNESLLAEVLGELKEAENDFRIAVWATLPTPIKNHIKDKHPKAA